MSQNYSDFLNFSLTGSERHLVQNKEVPLSIDEVRQRFPYQPIVIRVINGYALILESSTSMCVADFTSFLGTVTINLFYRGEQALFEKGQLLAKVREHVYGTTISP